MKKLSILGLIIGAFFMLSSCNSQKSAAKKSANGLRGDWKLAQIIGKDDNTIVITKVFDQAPLNCFEGSTWHFVENNNSGYYTLNPNQKCPSGENKISWHMDNDGDNIYFWFKRIGEGQKAKNVKSGYKMEVIYVDEYQALFTQEVPVSGGGKTTLNYYFNKL